MLCRSPHLFGAVYQIGKGVSKITQKSPVYYVNGKMSKYLAAYLEAHDFDVILMPHLYPAETLTYMKHNGYKLPLTVAIATDYTSIPFWGETDVDYYIIPHEDLKREFCHNGIPEEKLIPLGIPVSRQFDVKGSKQQARYKLGLMQEGEYFLVVGGSMAAGNIDVMVKELSRQGKPTAQIIVICGSNERLEGRLKKRYAQNERIHIIGYTRQMAKYMQACDLVFSKPGGLSSTEAAVANVLLVHTKPIPGCETINRRYFVRHHMSISSKTIEGQVRKGLKLLEDTEGQQTMLEAQKQHMPRHAADALGHFIENVLKER